LDEIVPISKISITLDKIIEHWRHTQLKLNDPATIDLINGTQQKISLHFPDDFTNFYLKVNGFKDWVMTNQMFCGCTLERIVEEFDNNNNFISFCDYLIDSHRMEYLKDNLGVYKDFYYDQTPKSAEGNFDRSVSNLDCSYIIQQKTGKLWLPGFLFKSSSGESCFATAPVVEKKRGKQIDYIDSLMKIERRYG